MSRIRVLCSVIKGYNHKTVFSIVYFVQRKLTIDDETEFCREEVISELLKSKVRSSIKCFNEH